jgi:hypothetical protein
MKTQSFFTAVGACSMLAGLSAQAAPVGLQPTKDSASPFYADFTSQDLIVSYNAGTGAFSASSTVAANSDFITGAQSPGTLNQFTSETAFTGSFTLNATIKFDSADGLYEVQNGGSFQVTGNLLGGTGSTVLLNGNLKSGPGSLGYNSTSSKSPQIFNFAFNTASGGNTSIFDDFFGYQNGAGDIILDTGTLATTPVYTDFNPNGFTGFGANFQNIGATAGGEADTFVPEPAVYPLACSLMTLLGMAFIRRPHTRNC